MIYIVKNELKIRLWWASQLITRLRAKKPAKFAHLLLILFELPFPHKVQPSDVLLLPEFAFYIDVLSLIITRSTIRP